MRTRATSALSANPPAKPRLVEPLADASATSQSVAVATGELAVEGITMTGDSGGPAFDAAAPSRYRGPGV
jgi:hypothetical protein